MDRYEALYLPREDSPVTGIYSADPQTPAMQAMAVLQSRLSVLEGKYCVLNRVRKRNRPEAMEPGACDCISKTLIHWAMWSFPFQRQTEPAARG